MSTYTYTVDSGEAPFLVEINPGALCTSNCTHSVLGSPVSTTYNSVGLPIGVNSVLTFTLTTANGCVTNNNFTHCCPTTGGAITGDDVPDQNTFSTYSLTGVTGTYTTVWSTVGGVGNSIITSNNTQVNINVGAGAFTLRATLSDCSGTRAVNFTISPQAPVCGLVVSNIVFSC